MSPPPKLKGLTLAKWPEWSKEDELLFSSSLKGDKKWKWVLALSLTLLLHWAFLSFKIPSWERSSPKVELLPINPAQLESIRRQWRSKSLLLHNQQPASETAPENARYLSDLNRRVEKEQRARQTQVLPVPGSSGQAQQRKKARSPRAAQKAFENPTLSHLGIPIRPPIKMDSSQDERDSPWSTEQSASPASPGHDQELADRNLPFGAQNLLNTQESIYYSFYSRIYQAIAPIWQSRIRELPQEKRTSSGEYSTSVDVILNEEGDVREVVMLRPSGIREFDDAVYFAWKKVPRILNPPKGLLNQNGEIHTGWTFTVYVSENTGWQFAPPSRSY